MNYDDTIELRDMKTSEGLDIRNRKAVVNTTINKVVGVVSLKYKLIHNVDLLRTITPAVVELGISEKEPIIKTTRGGAITFFKFMSEKITGEVAKGDIVRFGVEFYNSYDGSFPVGFHIIAERLVCLNGLVVPKSITEISIRHTRSANTSEVRDRLKEYFPKTTSAIDLWKSWSEIKPDRTRIDQFLKKSVGRKLRNEFLTRYMTLGSEKQNLWEFYNILTYYISHQIKVRKNEDIKALKQFQVNETWTNRLTEYFN